MPSDLEILIDYYQWEILRIKKLIEDNLEQHFYKEVEFDERALGNAQRELDRLLELKNPVYPDIKRTEYNIERYKKMSNAFPSAKGKLMAEYFKPQVEALKKELIELKKLEQPPSKEETQHIDNAIYQLIENTLKTIKIHLSIERKIFIQLFYLGQKEFQISFNSYEDELLWFYQYSEIRNHDFKLDLNKSELSMIFAVSNEKNILPLKNFLSKLIIGLKPSIKRIDSIYLELIDN